MDQISYERRHIFHHSQEHPRSSFGLDGGGMNDEPRSPRASLKEFIFPCANCPRGHPEAMRRLLFFIVILTSPVFALDKVTLVCEDDFAPYGYQSKTGEAAGFATDVVIAAYNSVGVDVKLKVMHYARCMELIEKGEEIGCYDTNNDSVNLAKHYFTINPLFVGEMVLWARNDYNGDMTVEKLVQSGALVGVTLGYNYDAPGVSFDYNDRVKKDVSRTVTTTLTKLVKGRYNFAAAEKKVARLAIARSQADLQGKVKVVGLIAYPGLFLSFSKKHPDGKKYRDLLDQGILNIKKSGKYSELERKWDELIRTNQLP